MKKINSIKQLKAEKKRLRQRQAELEKAIKYDWRDLKESIKPGHAGGKIFSSIFNKKEKQDGPSFIADGLAEMAAAFTRKMVEKAEEKWSKWFKK